MENDASTTTPGEGSKSTAHTLDCGNNCRRQRPKKPSRSPVCTLWCGRSGSGPTRYYIPWRAQRIRVHGRLCKSRAAPRKNKARLAQTAPRTNTPQLAQTARQKKTLIVLASQSSPACLARRMASFIIAPPRSCMDPGKCKALLKEVRRQSTPSALCRAGGDSRTGPGRE